MQDEKLKEFFKTHPHIDAVHIASGVLFIHKENADEFAKDAKKVKTFTREVIEADDDAAKQKAEEDKKAADDAAKQKVVDALQQAQDGSQKNK